MENIESVFKDNLDISTTGFTLSTGVDYQVSGVLGIPRTPTQEDLSNLITKAMEGPIENFYLDHLQMPYEDLIKPSDTPFIILKTKDYKWITKIGYRHKISPPNDEMDSSKAWNYAKESALTAIVSSAMLYTNAFLYVGLVGIPVTGWLVSKAIQNFRPGFTLEFSALQVSMETDFINNPTRFLKNRNIFEEQNRYLKNIKL